MLDLIFRFTYLDLWGLKVFYGSRWLRARLCVAVRYLTPFFWLFCFTPRWRGWRWNALPKEGLQEIYKGKDKNRQETKNFSFRLSFIYLVNGLTNATSKDIAWCPKHQIVKTVLSVRRHYPKRERFTENLSIYLFSPAPNSLLENPSNFGATASHWLLYILLFFFFLILNRMDAWSLMRGDAFIHFVSGSRRVYIRLGVLW